MLLHIQFLFASRKQNALKMKLYFQLLLLIIMRFIFIVQINFIYYYYVLHLLGMQLKLFIGYLLMFLFVRL